MFVFVAWACICLSVINKLDLGLDQTLSMPQDSYVIDYLKDINKYLSTGKISSTAGRLTRHQGHIHKI